MQPLKVNFTDKEASSKPREIPPSGEYNVNITDGEVTQVKPGKKNAGKDYWKLTFVIQDGAYAGQTLISTVMLFDGALFSLSQLMKALNYPVEQGGFVVPPLSDLLGKTVVVRGFKMPARFDQETNRELPERFEIKGYKRYTGAATRPSSSNLLPQ